MLLPADDDDLTSQPVIDRNIDSTQSVARSRPDSTSTSRPQSTDDISHQSCRARNFQPLTPSPSSEDGLSGDGTDSLIQGEGHTFFADNHDDRSVVLKGVPKSATLADITKIIRGGMILNVYTRLQQGMAHIAFVYPDAAEKFLIYATNNELSIRGKNVTAAWDEKQYYLQGGLASRIHHDGATRNLVIRFPKHDISEKTIREDLEHIHLLEVVDVQFRNGHIWISLNGVRNAINAKACMSTRLRYRKNTIDFWPDECAASPQVRKETPNQQRYFVPKQAAPSAFSNRFATLCDSNIEFESDY